ncbi:Nin one binding Zn-ribbon like protein [Ancylostoma ceylanicum]|uniref:Nin one binding Zn-ribbon like protein n=1 Tax=Ancylostoma ceylanicum TaxID=53326 RepID=A0A0D6LUX4_9BILA|nr:Nin one binding Zn-ribbon like protein [Ancylostoma ceylanicum]
MGALEVEEGLNVGCLTTDFALQNVLLSMNLGLVSLNGYRIKKLKTFVLRCRACFKTTPIMTKEFCPACGNKMLHKVSHFLALPVEFRVGRISFLVRRFCERRWRTGFAHQLAKASKQTWFEAFSRSSKGWKTCGED